MNVIDNVALVGYSFGSSADVVPVVDNSILPAVVANILQLLDVAVDIKSVSAIGSCIPLLD